jgi:phage-related protein
MTILSVDGFDLGTLGFNIENPQGWRDGPTSRQLLVAERVNRPGGIVIGDEPREGGRRITVAGVIKGSSAANCRTILDEIQERLAGGSSQVIFGDETDKYVDAWLERIETVGVGRSFVDRWLRLRILLHCPDPRRFATSASSVNGITTATDIPIGTAKVYPLLTINGTATNPTITYKDKDGTTVQTMAFGALSLGAADYLEIDCDALTIKLFDPSESNAIDELSGGDFIVLDPADADPWAPDWGTLEVSSGDLDVDYRKAYL